MVDLELIEDAARLLAFGLRPKLRPSADPTYGDLLKRYRADSQIRSLIGALTRGLGLTVLGVTDHGLILGAEDDGPFALRLADYRRQGLSVQDRMCHGLVQLAIAAWCFPTARHLEDHDSVLGTRISTGRMMRYLVDLCEELKARAEGDPSLVSPELEEAWRAVLSRAKTRSTPDGRRAPGTLSGMVAHALEHLESGGLLRRVSDDDGGTWQALGAYRLQVRELAAHDAFLLVREASRQEP